MKLSKDNYIAFSSPIGMIKVTEANGKVISIDLAVSGTRATANSSPVLKQARKEIESYFAGNLTKFTFPVDLSKGTEFQREVWKEIAKIKLIDLNANDLEAAKQQVRGTARSMGLTVVG